MAAAYGIRYCGPDNVVQANTMLANILAFTTCINYIAQSICYIILRWKYSAIVRPYNSPLGIPGAIISLAIFSFTVVGLLIYAKFVWQSVLCLIVWEVCGMFWYMVYGRYHLLLSPEEYRSMFVLYSIQFVRQKQQQALHKSTQKYVETSSKNSIRKASTNPTTGKAETGTTTAWN